jgi:CTP synthase
MTGAASSEFAKGSKNAVIDILPEQKKIEGLGGNMRLGGKEVLIAADTLAAFLFRGEAIKPPSHQLESPSVARSLGGSVADSFLIRKRFRHRYEVDPNHIEMLESHGLIFSGRHPQQPIMQVLELPVAMHPYFIGGQFHPELTSRPLKPSPMFMGLVAAAARHAGPHIPAEQISKRWLPRNQDTPMVSSP